MAPGRVDNLLARIYGPIRQDILFRPDFPPAGVKLVIHDLELRFEGEPGATGFDHTEFISNPPPGSHIAENPLVNFFGVIEIKDLDCLSEPGLGLLEKQFKEMDRSIHMEHAQSNTSIKMYYTHRRPDSRNLRVRICCCKTLLAHFLTSQNDPEKFLIYSEFQTKKRTYWIKSLSVATENASLKFIARYRTRAMILELIETDPDHVPLAERTVDWVVQRYREEILPRDKSLRFFNEITHEYAPRHLRHISTAEIRGYLAEHAEWLLAHMIARRQGSANLLDIPQWMLFCKQARTDSLEAVEHDVKWGSWDEPAHDRSYKLARRLAQFGESEQFWAKQLESIQRRAPTRISRRTRDLSPEAPLPEDSIQQHIDFQYDSDFSEGSSSDSSEPEEIDSDPYIDVTPQFCFQPPHIPNGQFVWNCPGCSYRIDLLNLSPENIAALPPDTVRVLVSKAWKVSDMPVKRALYRMVSSHYEVVHLDREEGLQVVRTSPKGWTVKKSRRVQPYPQVERSSFIKREEEESPPLRRSSRTSRPRTST